MSDVREVTSLPLASSVLDQLQRAGFRFVKDLQNVKALDLADELRISPQLALEIIQSVEKCSAVDSTQSTAVTGVVEVGSFTAKDLMSKSMAQKPVITFCKEIDAMLGGGVPCGQITEFCGVPGIGKTQMSIQLACNVQIPTMFRGADGECLYIDTEGSFLPERAYEVAKELSLHLSRVAKANAQSKPGSNTTNLLLALAQEMTPERFLEGIHYIRCHSQSELLATINTLSSFLKAKTKIRLIVIDSIAFHFRADIYDVNARNRTLSALAQQLNSLSFQHNLSVVVMNHVTSKVSKAQQVSSGGYSSTASAALDGSQLMLIPALGEHWSHSITNRILLHWKQSSLGNSNAGLMRVATLIKSPSMPVKTVNYIVNQRGVRDVITSSTATASSQATTAPDSDANKRPRHH